MSIIISLFFLFSGEMHSSSSDAVKVVDVSISTEVVVYEYKPRVIIEGGWGRGEDEFGRDIYDYESERDIYEPVSIAVSSKGEIYILDLVNNRIKKYDSEGKYLKSIPVNSYRYDVVMWYIVKRIGEHRWDSKWVVGKLKGGCCDGCNCHDVRRYYSALGVNIVIDESDRMYYYVERGEINLDGGEYKDWKEAEEALRSIKGKRWGEVWEIVNDEVVRKREVPGNLKGGLSYYNGSLWITEYPYEFVKTDIGEDYNVFEGKKYLRKDVNNKYKQSSEGGNVIRSTDNLVILLKNKKEIHIKPYKEERFITKGVVLSNNFIILSKRGNTTIRNYYNSEGRLIRRILIDNEPRDGVKDRKGNIYRLEEDDSKFRVTKYELRILGAE